MKSGPYKVVEDSRHLNTKMFTPWAVVIRNCTSQHAVSRFTSRVAADFDCRQRNRNVEGKCRLK